MAPVVNLSYGFTPGGRLMNSLHPITPFHFVNSVFRIATCLILIFSFFCLTVVQVDAAAKGKTKPPRTTKTTPPEPTPEPTPDPTPLPDPISVGNFSGGVGVFQTVTPLTEDSLQGWFAPRMSQFASFGIQYVNLVVHWFDLESKDNQFSFDILGKYIQAVKSAGLQCVLRIYFNGGSYIQASPDWLFTDKKASYCLEGKYKQPLPWDTVYLQELNYFMEALASWMSLDKNRHPEAMQISAGGIYGEMSILGYDWENILNNDYDRFFDMLMGGEKIHVDIFSDFSKKLGSFPIILMISPLYDNNIEKSDLLMDYGWNTHGLRWFQSNTWSGDLQEKTTWGWKILDMMERHTSGGFFVLEDEDGYSRGETLAKRINRMETIQSENGVHFTAVTLNAGDLTAANQTNIDYLVYWTMNR
jgi:hypothetical protein